MAQNFWIAIFAWTTCFVVTIAGQPGDAAAPGDRNLQGLVYGLTELPHDEGVSWYKRPVPLAIAVGVLALISEFLVCLTCWIYEYLRAVFFLIVGLILVVHGIFSPGATGSADRGQRQSLLRRCACWHSARFMLASRMARNRSS